MCGDCRAFNPESHGLPPSSPYKTSIQVDPLFPFRRLLSPSGFPDQQTLIINTDGACPSNGPNATSASFGVYFGPDCILNRRGLLPEEVPKTNNWAELFAIQYALMQVKTQGLHKYHEKIIIVSDSDFAVKALSIWFNNWMDKKFRRKGKKRVEHAELILDIGDVVREMEDEGCKVYFWWVPRKWNREADKLANEGLEGGEVAVWERNYRMCEGCSRKWGFEYLGGDEGEGACW